MVYIFILSIMVLVNIERVIDPNDQNLKIFIRLFILLLIVVSSAIYLDFNPFKKVKLKYKGNALFLVPGIVYIISLMRNNHPYISTIGLIWQVIFFVLLIFFLRFIIFKEDINLKIKINNYIINKNWKRIGYCIVIAPTIFVIVSIILFLFGFEDRTTNVVFNTSTGTLGSLIGLNIERLKFPLSNGLNNFGTIAGISLIANSLYLVHIKTTKIVKIFTILFILISILAIIATDTRWALASCVISFIIINIVSVFKKVHTVKWVLLLSPLIPILLFLTMGVINQLSFLSIFSRNYSDLGTLSSRAVIWQVNFEELSSFKINHLIGYGEYGHVGAGISKHWGYIFSSWKNYDGDLATTHNNFFQIILNDGYIGLVIFLIYIYSLASKLINIIDITQKLSLVLLGILMYLIFSGFMESNITYIETVITLIMITTYAISFRINKEIIQNENCN